MRSRALAAWSASALAISLATDNPLYRALALLCALNLLLAARRAGTSLRPLLLGAGIAAATATALTLLLSHTGSHVLVRLPSGLPVIGGALTWEALVFGAASGLGLAAALLAAAPLALCLQPHELVDALPAALARSGAALGTALTLIPRLGRSATEIRDAQRMRGWRPRRLRGVPDLAVPVVLTALEGSMALAEAMEARGYASGARTHFSAARWEARSAAVAAASLLAALAFLALRAGGVVPDWYPFPSLSWPGVALPAVACCAALALPALLWRAEGSR